MGRILFISFVMGLMSVAQGAETPTQLEAMRVLADQLADRMRRGDGQYYIEAPKWLNDVDTWLRGLPLPKDE